MYPSPSYFLDARSANSVGLQCREVARRVWYRLRSSCSPARYWAIRPSPPAPAAFGFLLRQGYHYGRSAWTKLYRRWLAGLKFERAVHHIVLEDYIAAVEAAEARRDRLTAQIEAMLPDWTLAGRGGAADDARHGLGQCRNTDHRTGRPLAFCQSAYLGASEHSSGANCHASGCGAKSARHFSRKVSLTLIPSRHPWT